jgi:hypothetical protein
MKNYKIIKILLSIILTVQVIYCKFEWTEWSKKDQKCERNCSKPLGKIKQTRSCQSCIQEPNTKSKTCQNTDIHKCFVDLKGSNETFTSCYDANNCDGLGLYTGDWGDWLPVSPCEKNVDTPCNSSLLQGLRKFHRDCIITNKSVQVAHELKKLGEKYHPICSGDSKLGNVNEKYVLCHVN